MNIFIEVYSLRKDEQPFYKYNTKYIIGVLKYCLDSEEYVC